jgi:hypothetical protein
MANNTYEVEYAKTGRSGCKNKKCELGKVIDQHSVRIGKVHPSPFSEGASMADWYHPACFFDAMMRTLAKTLVPMSSDDIKGWEDLEAADEALLQPLLDEFVLNRKAKLAGTLPKKPKAPKTPIALSAATTSAASPSSSSKKTLHAAAPASNADWFSPAPSPKKNPLHGSSAPSASHTPAKSGDKHGLKAMLDPSWYAVLAPLIGAVPEMEQLLSTFCPNVPNKSRLFESLRGLDAGSVSLIIIDQKTSFLKQNSASGYPFNDAADKTLATANPQLSSFLRLCRTYNNAQGFIVDWEDYSTRAPQSWYEAMKKQGVLFLHRELSSDPNSVAPNTTWDAVVLKIIKTVFVAREKNRLGGVTIACFGEGLESLKRNLERILKRFYDPSNAVPLRFVVSPMPDNPAFTSDDSNPFEMIDTFLVELDCKPLDWFPEKEGPIAPVASVAPIAPKSHISTPSVANSSSTDSKTKYPSTPVLSGKMTSRLQLTSMDGKPGLDLGKFHRDPAKKGSFLLRSLDLNRSDPLLSSHIATFTIADAKTISIVRHGTNPIFLLDSITGSATSLEVGQSYPLKRGDIMSFAGDEYTYRLDPYNFDNPPQNRYMIEGGTGSNSTHASVHEEDHMEVDLGPRLQDAKRPLEDFFGDTTTSSVTTAPKKAKKGNMDWMDDDEDDDGLEDGDAEYRPSKHGESAYDHVIDDGEGGDSDDDNAAFFADSRPICMYGSKCFRKNPAHLAQYKHPPKSG